MLEANRESAIGRPQCRQFDLELADFLEGEERPFIQSHARQCTACSNLLEDLGALRRVSVSLAEEEPPARMWANLRVALVQEGIIRTQKSFWQRIFGSLAWGPSPVTVTALAGVAALALFFLSTPGRLDRHAGLFSQGSVQTADLVSAQDNTLHDVTSATEDMERTFHARAASYDPTVKQTYQKSLDSLNEEIRQCQAAMEQEPANSMAREYLSQAYVQKAQVLQSALEYEGQ